MRLLKNFEFVELTLNYTDDTDDVDRNFPKQEDFVVKRKYVYIERYCVNSDISQISISVIKKGWNKE